MAADSSDPTAGLPEERGPSDSPQPKPRTYDCAAIGAGMSGKSSRLVGNGEDGNAQVASKKPGGVGASSGSPIETPGGVNSSFGHSTFREGELEELEKVAQSLESDALSPQYSRRLEKELHAYQRWCEEQGLVAIPAGPGVLLLYLAHLIRDDRPRTLDVVIAAIDHAHARRDLPRPSWVSSGRRRRQDLRELLKGHRIRGLEQQGGET